MFKIINHQGNGYKITKTNKHQLKRNIVSQLGKEFVNI